MEGGVYDLIVDITGTILIPGNQGNDCPGNGTNPEIECCCDGCDYMLCCLFDYYPSHCSACKDMDCPHAPANKQHKDC